MSKQVTLGEQFRKQTFEALALQVPGGHFLIFYLFVLHYTIALSKNVWPARVLQGLSLAPLKIWNDGQ